MLDLFPDNEPLRRWITKAEERVAFQGLPARICWLGYGERDRAGVRFNELVANGEVSAPIVIGRDHLDSGSVASPYRETESMLDGSDAIADWPLLNALVNTASGASWVSIHHGGGVGIGRSIHAGQVCVADGTRPRRREAAPGAHERSRDGRPAPRGRRLRDRRGDRGGDGAARPHARRLMTTRVLRHVGELTTNDPTLGDESALGRLHEAALVVDEEQVLWVGADRDAPDADELLDAEGARGRARLRRLAHPPRLRRRAQRRVRSANGRPALRRRGDQAHRRRYSRGLPRGVACGHGETGARTRRGRRHDGRDQVRVRARRLGGGSPARSGARVHERGDLARGPRGAAGVRRGPRPVPRPATTTMLDACAPLARWADVFCDRGAFSVDEARHVLTRASMKGLAPRLHANQLAHSGAIALAVELDCSSVDHCTFVEDEDLDLLSASATVATLLPGAEFSTRSTYPSARRLLDAGVTVALATDCNPGSSYVTSMGFVIALAVREMAMTVDEALWAATRGGALALRRDDVGHLGVGARADFAILDAPRAAHLAYRPGANLVAATHRAA